MVALVACRNEEKWLKAQDFILAIAACLATISGVLPMVVLSPLAGGTSVRGRSTTNVEARLGARIPIRPKVIRTFVITQRRRFYAFRSQATSRSLLGCSSRGNRRPFGTIEGYRRSLARPTRFERVTFAFGGQLPDHPRTSPVCVLVQVTEFTIDMKHGDIEQTG
jgi:hypothetical protein